ncbi:MAG TPA: FYDLN acid domain-containing protein [Candidatus Nitrosotenuis sp.]|nr:FYDLN acid domain-containing protein [Candidatus Nitrosotenuis sp.]
MVKLEWGTKRTCQSCLSRFYDLQKSPIICPKCGTQFEINVPGRRTRNRTGVDESKVVPFENDVLLDQDLDLSTDLDEDIDDDALIEDTSDLDEDIDDMSDMIDVDEKEDR